MRQEQLAVKPLIRPGKDMPSGSGALSMLRTTRFANSGTMKRSIFPVILLGIVFMITALPVYGQHYPPPFLEPTTGTGKCYRVAEWANSRGEEVRLRHRDGAYLVVVNHELKGETTSDTLGTFPVVPGGRPVFHYEECLDEAYLWQVVMTDSAGNEVGYVRRGCDGAIYADCLSFLRREGNPLTKKSIAVQQKKGKECGSLYGPFSLGKTIRDVRTQFMTLNPEKGVWWVIEETVAGEERFGARFIENTFQEPLPGWLEQWLTEHQLEPGRCPSLHGGEQVMPMFDCNDCSWVLQLVDRMRTHRGIIRRDCKGELIVQCRE